MSDDKKIEIVKGNPKDLNISTVVEGIETKDDEILIKRMGCKYGQGYYYSKPISSDEFDLKFMNNINYKN